MSAESNISNVFRIMKRGNLKHSIQANDNLWTDNDSATTERYEDWLKQENFGSFENSWMTEFSVWNHYSVWYDRFEWLKSNWSNLFLWAISDALVISVGGNTSFEILNKICFVTFFCDNDMIKSPDFINWTVYRMTYNDKEAYRKRKIVLQHIREHASVFRWEFCVGWTWWTWVNGNLEVLDLLISLK